MPITISNRIRASSLVTRTALVLLAVAAVFASLASWAAAEPDSSRGVRVGSTEGKVKTYIGIERERISSTHWWIEDVTAIAEGPLVDRCRSTRATAVVHIGRSITRRQRVSSDCDRVANGKVRQRWVYEVPGGGRVANKTLIWTDWSHLFDFRNQKHTDPAAPKLHVMEDD